jgi:hypothetical protein
MRVDNLPVAERHTMTTDNHITLPGDDFRRERTYLSPSIFFWPNGEPDEWPPPTDLIDCESWDHITSLATHVALASSSYDGSSIARMNQLHSDWVFSWPAVDTAPFMNYPALIAGEEFDALVFNALHGYYQQAIGCLRVALETLCIAAAFAVTTDTASFDAWQAGKLEGKFGRARVLLRDSTEGSRIDAATTPGSVFGDTDDSWLRSRYKRLCDYVHSRAGHDNGAFWESNGPLYVPAALVTVEREFRETLALCYLLERLGWPGYAPGQGQPALLDGPQNGWSQYDALLRFWLL